MSEANETFDRRYERKPQGYDLGRVAERVALIYELNRDAIFQKGRQKDRVAARDLFCFWRTRELGLFQTELARSLGMSVPGIGYAVGRGESIFVREGYQLVGSVD